MTTLDLFASSTSRAEKRILVTLGFLLAFASLSVDICLPAMPTMQRSLHTAMGQIEWTVSAYMLGFSGGQLLWGPISDRHGRRLPLAWGLSLFAVGSAGCSLAPDFQILIACRIIQAVGACAGVVLARAMVRDLYGNDRSARIMANLMLIVAIAPTIGPLIGGQILLWWGWRAIFASTVFISLLAAIAMRSLPETLPPGRRSDESLSRHFLGYAQILRNRRLWTYAGCVGFFYAGMFAYLSGTPFAYITYYGVSAQQYGWLFAAGSVGMVLGNMINMKLLRTLHSDRVMRAGALWTAVWGLVLVATAATGWGGIWGAAIPMSLFVSAVGVILANSISGALGCVPGRTGAASAVIGTVHYGCAIVGSALVGVFADGSLRPLSWVMATSGLGCLLCSRFIATQPRRT